jgi:hypothetical protein
VSPTATPPAKHRKQSADPSGAQCRKQQITTQTSELEALEARIREMEMRLKGEGAANNAAGAKGSAAAAQSTNNSNAPPPPPAKDHPADQNRAQQQQQHKYGGSRPGTARQSQPAVPGALPPTPAGSEGEFEPSVVSPSRIAPRPPAIQAYSPPSASKAAAGAYSHPSAQTLELPVAGGDSDSVKSVSESASFADYVIVPEPDGDRERDA